MQLCAYNQFLRCLHELLVDICCSGKTICISVVTPCPFQIFYSTQCMLSIFIHIQHMLSSAFSCLCFTHSLFQGVSHGDRVALQLVYDKPHWLRCRPYGRTCLKGGCPDLYMECNDWTTCTGEVFEIYRVSGPGSVHVGDKIGLYYPHARGYWFSMGRGSGLTARCPGIPSRQHGFSENCLGEIFKIYARGKAIGDPILEHDNIALFQVRVSKWIKLVSINAPAHSTCLGNVRPPPTTVYHSCRAEIFELWLQ